LPKYSTIAFGHGRTRKPSGINKLHRRMLRSNGFHAHPTMGRNMEADASSTWTRLVEQRFAMRRLLPGGEASAVLLGAQNSGRRLPSHHDRRASR